MRKRRGEQKTVTIVFLSLSDLGFDSCAFIERVRESCWGYLRVTTGAFGLDDVEISREREDNKGIRETRQDLGKHCMAQNAF